MYANPFFKETVHNHQPEDKNLIQFVDSESSGILQGLLGKTQESLGIVQERARVFDLHEPEYNVIVRYYPEQERYYLVFSKEAGEQSQALHIRDTLTVLPNRVEYFLDSPAVIQGLGNPDTQTY